MKVLVIGLGSMGKRRVRNLLALKEHCVVGFDVREDRRKEANDKYGIHVFDNIEDSLKQFNPEAFVISTPPDLHMKYAYLAYECNIHCFIEASVTDKDKIVNLAEKIRGTKIIMAPSCTMRYFRGPSKIRELIENNAVGKILNVNYQAGQYLPDWHPWEGISEFYVSNRETGGCREIVPFELTWLNEIFGQPKALACVRRKLTDMNADIDDIYHNILEYENDIIANITVEVVSRPKATRDIRILGDKGEIVYSADQNNVRYINIDMEDWDITSFDKGTIEKSCINPEEPYINEMSDFILAAANEDPSLFPNSLEKDVQVLNVLGDLEALS